MHSVDQTNYKFLLFDKLKILILLCFSGVVVFFATLYSPFLYDDAHAIQDNPYIKDLSEFQKTVGIQNIFNRSILLLTFSKPGRPLSHWARLAGITVCRQGL